MRISKRLSVLAASLVLGGGLLAAPSANAGEVNTGYFGDVAIEGYDPVAYFTMHKAVRGDESHNLQWLGANWHFVSRKHRDLFAENPIAYAPQYGGHCADGVAYGDKTANIDPEAWVIIDDKLYLNSVKSAKEEFEQSAEIRLKAEANWPDVREFLMAQ